MGSAFELLVVLVDLKTWTRDDARKHFRNTFVHPWCTFAKHKRATVRQHIWVCDWKSSGILPPRSFGGAPTICKWFLVPVRQHLRDARAEDFLIIRGRSCTPLQALFPPTLCPLAEAQSSPDVAEPLLQATSYIFTCHPYERLWTKLDSGCSLFSGRGRSDWCRSKNWILVPLLRLPWGGRVT